MHKHLAKKDYLNHCSIFAAMITLAGLLLVACGKSGSGVTNPGTTKAFGLAARAQDSAITLNWPRISDAKKYNLYWSLAPGVTKSIGTKIANVTTPYHHAGLTNGTPVYYVLTVETSAGEGAESLEISLAPNATVSGVPGYLDGAGNDYLRAVGQDGRVELHWSGVANATSYNVYRKTSRGEVFGDVILDVTSPAAFTGLQNDKTYYFVVTAIVAGVESALSNEVVALPYTPETLTRTPGKAPEMPHHVYVYAGDQQATIYLDEQDDQSDALRYTIYWNTSGNVTSADAHISDVVLPYTHTGLTNRTRYYYRVVAQNQHGDSDLAPMNSISSIPNNYTIEDLKAGVSDGNLWSCITETAVQSGWKYQRQLDWVDCHDKKTSDLTIDLMGLDNFSNLYTFDLRQLDNKAITVQNLGVLEHLPNLYTLWLKGDGIVDLNFLSGLANLTSLDLSDNLIVSLEPLAVLQNLESLYLENNRAVYTDKNFSVLGRLPKLHELGLQNNGIVDLGFLSSGFANLIWLNLGDSAVYTTTNFNILKQLPKLYGLGLKNNGIVDLNLLSELPNLTWLDLSKNQITDITPLKKLTNLQVLDYSNTSIADLGALAAFPHLRELSLQSNAIVDVTPLATLTQLTKLDLKGNLIVNVTDLASLTALEYLDLSNNKIGGVGGLDKLTALTKATYLGLSGYGASLSCVELDQLMNGPNKLAAQVDLDGNSKTFDTFKINSGVNCTT